MKNIRKSTKILFSANIALVALFLLCTEVVFDCTVSFTRVKYFLLAILIPPACFYCIPEKQELVCAVTLAHTVIVLIVLFACRSRVYFMLCDRQNNIVNNLKGKIIDCNANIRLNGVVVILNGITHQLKHFEELPPNANRRKALLKPACAEDVIEQVLQSVRPTVAPDNSNVLKEIYLEFIDPSSYADLDVLVERVMAAKFSRRLHGYILSLEHPKLINLTADKITRSPVSSENEMMRILDAARRSD